MGHHDPGGQQVYPRACGGTNFYGDVLTGEDGLSPRLRGNQGHNDYDNDPQRSIPAPAGEPRLKYASKSNVSVYPRACGGTGMVLAIGCAVAGLSPRLRGNQGHVQLNNILAGSIPAPAGEPIVSPYICQNKRVYPRACGGTSKALLRNGTRVGLSPRLRGNRRLTIAESPCTRSIPAPAGEPASNPST